MKLTDTDDQRMLRETAERFARKRSPISRVRALRDSGDPKGYTPQIWQTLADLGLVSVHIAESEGGSGLGFADLCILLETSGRQLMPDPFYSTLLLGTSALQLGADDLARRAWLPRIASGDAIVAVATDEPGARYDLSRISTSMPDGTLHGLKTQVLDAQNADLLLIPARDGGGLGLYCVDPQGPGVRIEPQTRIDHRAAARVHLDGAPAIARLDDGDGLKLLTRVADRARIGLAAEALGLAQQAFDLTIEWLKTRVQFDVTIGSFQALQHRAARLFLELALTRSAVLAAAQAVDNDDPDLPRMASLAKARAGQTALQVTEEAVQMHGGIGMTDEHDIGFYLKRARAIDATLGDVAFHANRWAHFGGY